jgi:DNA processing protein
VGSRHVDQALIEYTEEVSRLASGVAMTIVSGGARGIDQAAMRGALQSRGRVTGVLAHGLERAAMALEHRELIMDGLLTLVSPYDPAVGFDVGHAMQRNKLIYALADAALVVRSDFGTGGTWAGAIEQLEKLRFGPVFVRLDGQKEKGNEALRQKGALPWPNPTTPEELAEQIAAAVNLANRGPTQHELLLAVGDEPGKEYAVDKVAASASPDAPVQSSVSLATPADELFAKVRELLTKMNGSKSVLEVATELDISKGQAKDWLQRLVEEGVLDRKQKPLRYFVPLSRQDGLFRTGD